MQQPEKSWEEKREHREEAIRSVKRSQMYTLLSNLRQGGALPLDGAATPDPTDSSTPKRRWEASIQSWKRDIQDAVEKVPPGLVNIYVRRRAFDDTEIGRKSAVRSSDLNGLPLLRRRATTANPPARNQAAELSRNTDDIAQMEILRRRSEAVRHVSRLHLSAEPIYYEDGKVLQLKEKPSTERAQAAADSIHGVTEAMLGRLDVEFCVNPPRGFYFGRQ